MSLSNNKYFVSEEFRAAAFEELEKRMKWYDRKVEGGPLRKKVSDQSVSVDMAEWGYRQLYRELREHADKQKPEEKL